MKSSESVVTWDLLRDLDHQSAVAQRRGREGAHVAVSVEVLDELIGRWKLVSADHDDAFPVFYAGPGRHPDHPELSCLNCGHSHLCSTHNSPHLLDGPCSCGKVDKNAVV